MLSAMPFDFVDTVEFFHLLYKDADFCEGLGKVMLAAGMLETNLRQYLKAKAVTKVRSTSTLGTMVVELKKHHLLSKNGEAHFDDLAKKRNYLAHSLYDLFSGEIQETLLPRADVDVEMFSYKALALAEDFLHFSKLVAAADRSKEVLL